MTLKEAQKIELIIDSFTLSDRKIRKSWNIGNVIGSETSDTYRTERATSLIKNDIKQNCKLLLWLSVRVVIGDKRARLTHWGGGIPIRSIESFKYVLRKLEERGKNLIDSAKQSDYFSSPGVSPPYLEY